MHCVVKMANFTLVAGRLPTEQREWVQAGRTGHPRLGQAGSTEAGTSAQH